MDAIAQIHDIILEMRDDPSVPKNVVAKLLSLATLLKGDEDDVYIKVDKAIQIVDELQEDSNLQGFIRTRLWNICSLLESI
jgi:uncharacterized protein (UPF0147 family)